MTRSFLPSTAAALIFLGGAPAALTQVARAQEMPTYEYSGLPITPHQQQVLAADQVREQQPAPPLAQDGMPASPHQLAVLRTTTRATR